MCRLGSSLLAVALLVCGRLCWLAVVAVGRSGSVLLVALLLVGCARCSVNAAAGVAAGRSGSVLLAVALLVGAGLWFVALGAAGRLWSVLLAVVLLVGAGRWWVALGGVGRLGSSLLAVVLLVCCCWSVVSLVCWRWCVVLVGLVVSRCSFGRLFWSVSLVGGGAVSVGWWL